MNASVARRLVLWLTGIVVGLGTSLLPLTAAASQQLFRVQQESLGPVASQLPLQPYTSVNPAVAEVGTTAPAAKFTLPRGFLSSQNMTSTSYFPGYVSIATATYINGEARFRPNNPYGASIPTRVVFPTTGGNSTPNYGSGNPVTPTTTHNGNYDFQKGGSIFITPGPNRFGGTMRILYEPSSFFYQYISASSPFISKAYGTYGCTRMGLACTEGFETEVGEITSSGMVTRFRMTDPDHTQKATLNGNYISREAHYLHIIAPWTTGMVQAYDPNSYYGLDLVRTGYDQAFAPPTTRTVSYSTYVTLTTPTTGGGTTTLTFVDQQLTGITRITSLVKPRLKHVYLRSSNPGDPIIQNFQGARLQLLKVFFLPEPAGAVLLGAGIAVLVGLGLRRRRR